MTATKSISISAITNTTIKAKATACYYILKYGVLPSNTALFKNQTDLKNELIKDKFVQVFAKGLVANTPVILKFLSEHVQFVRIPRVSKSNFCLTNFIEVGEIASVTYNKSQKQAKVKYVEINESLLRLDLDDSNYESVSFRMLDSKDNSKKPEQLYKVFKADEVTDGSKKSNQELLNQSALDMFSIVAKSSMASFVFDKDSKEFITIVDEKLPLKLLTRVAHLGLIKDERLSDKATICYFLVKHGLITAKSVLLDGAEDLIDELVKDGLVVKFRNCFYLPVDNAIYDYFSCIVERFNFEASRTPDLFSLFEVDGKFGFRSNFKYIDNNREESKFRTSDLYDDDVIDLIEMQINCELNSKGWVEFVSYRMFLELSQEKLDSIKGLVSKFPEKVSA